MQSPYLIVLYAVIECSDCGDQRVCSEDGFAKYVPF